MEDYLKAIYRLGEREPTVTAHQLANELSVSGASVTNMVKRLEELNLVDYSRYKGVTLTEPGRKIALEVIRHHRAAGALPLRVARHAVARRSMPRPSGLSITSRRISRRGWTRPSAIRRMIRTAIRSRARTW